MAGEFMMEFESVWMQTAGKVRAYMFCACGSWADADDLLQDCYLRALRGWQQFEGTGSRQAWLFGIAKRTCVDWFRRKSRENVTVGLENIELSDDVSSRVDTDEIEEVWGAVKGLKAEYAEVIHLRFAAGLSYAETAQVLSVPVGTVRSRLHRGLKAVREKIKGQENGT